MGNGCLGTKSSRRAFERSVPNSAADPDAAANDYYDEALKDYDKDKSINLLGEFYPDVSPINDQTSKAAATKIQKQARRKAAKLRAEKERRWIVFSNLDLDSETDMVHVARFMQILFQKAPEIENLLREQLRTHEKQINSDALAKLNENDSEFGSDRPPLSPDSTHINRRNSAMNIDVVRKNSQDFLSALRTIRETSDVRASISVADIQHNETMQNVKLDKLRHTTGNLDNPKGTKSGSVLSPARPNGSGKLASTSNHGDSNSFPSPAKGRKSYWNTGKPKVAKLDLSGNEMDDSNNENGSSLHSSNLITSGRSDRSNSDPMTSSRLSDKSFNDGRNLTDIFTFERIALSSELEKTTTLEEIIPDEEELKNNFNLPSGDITPYSVDLLIALFKKKGKLSMDSLYKILRLSFKKMKSLSNISRIQINRSFERLTVVGDLHGK